MKTVLKIALMAIAYLALFIMGAWSVAILAMRLAERSIHTQFQ